MENKQCIDRLFDLFKLQIAMTIDQQIDFGFSSLGRIIAVLTKIIKVFDADKKHQNVVVEAIHFGLRIY